MLSAAKRFVINNAWFAFPFAVACLALFWFAAKASVWLDEAFTLQEAQFSYGVLWQALHHVDGTFLAYYGLLHVWIRIAGTGALALRIPSIAGVLAGLGFLYASIARRTDAFSASVATAFVAAAALTVSIGGEARPYGLAFGFCAVTLHALQLPYTCIP